MKFDCCHGSRQRQTGGTKRLEWIEALRLQLDEKSLNLLNAHSHAIQNRWLFLLLAPVRKPSLISSLADCWKSFVQATHCLDLPTRGDRHEMYCAHDPVGHCHGRRNLCHAGILAGCLGRRYPRRTHPISQSHAKRSRRPTGRAPSPISTPRSTPASSMPTSISFSAIACARAVTSRPPTHFIAKPSSSIRSQGGVGILGRASCRDRRHGEGARTARPPEETMPTRMLGVGRS